MDSIGTDTRRAGRWARPGRGYFCTLQSPSPSHDAPGHQLPPGPPARPDKPAPRARVLTAKQASSSVRRAPWPCSALHRAPHVMHAAMHLRSGMRRHTKELHPAATRLAARAKRDTANPSGPLRFGAYSQKPAGMAPSPRAPRRPIAAAGEHCPRLPKLPSCPFPCASDSGWHASCGLRAEKHSTRRARAALGPPPPGSRPCISRTGTSRHAKLRASAPPSSRE